MKKKIMPVLIAIGVALVALIVIAIGNVIDKNTPSKTKASEEEILQHFLLYDGYEETEDGYNFENAVKADENQVAIVLQNQVRKERGFVDENGMIYLGVGFVKNHLNHRFYWDNNENILIYTTPTDVIKAEVGSKEYYVTKVKNAVEYTIVRTQGQEVYVALDFVKLYSDIDTTYYENPKRLCITNTWDVSVDVATIESGVKIRMKDSIKADILCSYKGETEVVLLEEVEKWRKVVTPDGYTGYVQTSVLKNQTTKTYTSTFEKPVYTNIQKEGKISLAWHQITSPADNDDLVDLVTNAKGLNVVSPTWFRLSDNEGNFSSHADVAYTTRADMLGLEVWAMIDDQSPDSDNRLIFPYTSKRERLINQLIAAAIEYNLDGINIDFEYITEDIAEDYIQFLRELSVKCRINGIVLSVDNKVPAASNLFYDREEQGEIVDYVIIMGYDEHWGVDSGAGSVASLPWVIEGIENTLKSVPAAKVINALPFYTRIWQVDAEDKVLDTRAVGIQLGIDTLTQNGVTPVWVENVGQNYGEFTASDNTIYRIWLEDSTSIEEKVKLIDTYSLAGVAAWRLGLETDEIWNTIIKYTN